MMYYIIIVFVFSTSVVSSQSHNYTNPQLCPINKIHTMIKYSTNASSSECGTIHSILTNDKINQIVEKHNSLRDRVAKGLEHRGSDGRQPPAVKIPHLSWDKELAEIAQRWANQCTFANDDCRNVDRFPVGQNVIRWDSLGPEKMDEVNLILFWSDEVNHFNPLNVDNFTSDPSNKTRNYSQMVWANTTLIGCGSISYSKNYVNHLFLVCNYGPSGNVPGGIVYEISIPTPKKYQPPAPSAAPRTLNLWPMDFLKLFIINFLIFFLKDFV